MPVSLLWAVNAGRDFDRMFEPHELSEEHLWDLTLPLADEGSSEAAAAVPQTVNAPEVSGPSPRQQGEMQHAMVGGDQGFGNAGAASRKRTAARRAQAAERPGRMVYDCAMDCMCGGIRLCDSESVGAAGAVCASTQQMLCAHTKHTQTLTNTPP